MLLMRWCCLFCWCTDAAYFVDALMRWCFRCADALMLWCADADDVLMLLIGWCCLCCWCADATDALMLLMRWCCVWCWCAVAVDALMLLILLMCLCYWCCWFGLSDFSLYCDHCHQSHHSIYVPSCCRGPVCAQKMAALLLLDSHRALWL